MKLANLRLPSPAKVSFPPPAAAALATSPSSSSSSRPPTEKPVSLPISAPLPPPARAQISPPPSLVSSPQESLTQPVRRLASSASVCFVIVDVDGGVAIVVVVVLVVVAAAAAGAAAARLALARCSCRHFRAVPPPGGPCAERRRPGAPIDSPGRRMSARRPMRRPRPAEQSAQMCSMKPRRAARNVQVATKRPRRCLGRSHIIIFAAAATERLPCGLAEACQTGDRLRSRPISSRRRKWPSGNHLTD